MVDYANLPPGGVVPKSGLYRCVFCGHGGIADFLAKHLEGASLETRYLIGQSRQQTVKHLWQGDTFPECAVCGPATGWTLIEEADAKAGMPAARHDESVSESSVCDICTQKVFRPNGYLLTTREVVGTAAYWQHYCEHHKSELAGMGVSSLPEFRRNPLVRASCGEALARQSTPWMVCDRCIQMFTVDREQAQSYARQWWDSGRKYSPPGAGPAPLSAVNMGDDRVRFSSDDVATQTQSQPAKKWWEFWK